MSTMARDLEGKFCFLIWSVKLSTSPQFFNLINYKSQTMIRLGFWYWFVILSVIRYEHEKFYSRLCFFFYFCANEQERLQNSGQILYDDIDLRVLSSKRRSQICDVTFSLWDLHSVLSEWRRSIIKAQTAYHLLHNLNRPLCRILTYFHM